jgi:hypothetical protein
LSEWMGREEGLETTFSRHSIPATTTSPKPWSPSPPKSSSPPTLKPSIFPPFPYTAKPGTVDLRYRPGQRTPTVFDRLLACGAVVFGGRDVSMDPTRFDALARSVGSSTSRRRLLAGLAGGALGLIGMRSTAARTCSAPGTICREHATCCTGECGEPDRRGRRRCTGCNAASDCPESTDPCGGTATCDNYICGNTPLTGPSCGTGGQCDDGRCFLAYPHCNTFPCGGFGVSVGAGGINFCMPVQDLCAGQSCNETSECPANQWCFISNDCGNHCVEGCPA